MSMSNLEEMTNKELVDKIQELQGEIESLGEDPTQDPDPGHDLYRAVMWLECMSCGNRYVDQGDCSICRPAKTFLQKWREEYPWKSDQKGPAREPIAAHA